MNRRLIAGVAAFAAVAAAGAAVGATKLASPKAESEAIVADAAQQLGIDPSRLSEALKKAIERRIDAAVADGRLTRAQADALEARIEAGDVPLFFPPKLGLDRHGPFGHHLGGLDAAAAYLGLAEADLRAALEGGKSLADVAKEQGKSVDGLVQALVDRAAAKLNAAVAAGRLTDAQRDALVAGLRQRIADAVNGAFPGPRPGHRGWRLGPSAT